MMGTEIKAAAIAAALGAFAGGAPGEAPVGTEQRSNAGAHLVPGAGPAGAATMRAAVQRRYGPPAVLQVAEIERPLPGRGDVLVQVVAASVHPGDYFVMTGEPYVVRLVFGLRRPRHGIPGRDLAGVVAAVGKDVTDLQPGDEVFGWSTAGTLAEYACVPADNLAPVPANLPVVEAAAVPTSAMTALQALRDIAHVRPGQTVLVTGASGGVGTFAVQIAKAFGAEVTGVCSTGNLELVRSIGADRAIDYSSEDFTRGGERYDLIFDLVQGRGFGACRRVLAPEGRLVAGGILAVEPTFPRMARWGLRVVADLLRARFGRQKLVLFVAKLRADDLAELAVLVATGKVTPVIGARYPLRETAAAIRHLAGGHARGKIVITIGRGGATG
jgi:NADPH:quinone reductase-like Zn-dependent oxidoreductase